MKLCDLTVVCPWPCLCVCVCIPFVPFAALLEGRGLANFPGIGRFRALSATHTVRALPSSGPLPGLDGQVQCALLVSGAGGALEEAALLLRDYRAVVLNDVAFEINNQAMWDVLPFMRSLTDWLGAYRRLGAVFGKLMIVGNRDAAARWAAEVAAWDFDKVLSTHFDGLVSGDGRSQFKAAFRGLLPQEQQQQLEK